jgi:tRNA-specific 2-thiouridylase
MKKTVAVALSGGLDSAFAAALLKRQNYRVIGLYFQTGYEVSPSHTTSPTRLPQTYTRAQRVAEQVGIYLEVIDCSRVFEREVVGYFIDTYRSGQTPNPCVVCNQRIKFSFVLEHAKALGASALATGHYARKRQEPSGRISLLRGVDDTKDQSYFLSRLTQEQLRQAMFPLGTCRKKRIREIAKRWRFSSSMEGESQELCFVRHPSYKDFLSRLGGFPCEPGAIVNTSGDVLGKHQGLHAYTVGQRRGISIPGPEPYYVIRLDNKQNRLVIGAKSELAAHECTVTHINWIGMRPPEKPISVQTRIRYRHLEADSTVTPLGHDTARVRFAKAQYAIAPGQAAVFYQGERVLGGGWIACNGSEGKRP